MADGRGLSIWIDLTPDSSSQLFPGYKCRSWIWAWSTPWGFSRRSSWGCFRVLTEWHWRTDLEGARLASCSCSQQPRSPEWHPHFKWTENNFKNISLRSFVWHFDISIEILNSVPVMYSTGRFWKKWYLININLFLLIVFHRVNKTVRRCYHETICHQSPCGLPSLISNAISLHRTTSSAQSSPPGKFVCPPIYPRAHSDSPRSSQNGRIHEN